MKLILSFILCVTFLHRLGYAQEEVSTLSNIAADSTIPTDSASAIPIESTTILLVDSTSSEPGGSTEPTTEAATSGSTESTTDAATSGTTATTTIADKPTSKLVNNLSDQIKGIIQHFRDPHTVGFPGQTILPDALPVPNATQDIGLGEGYFYNMTVHGLSNFTLESVNMLMDQMQVYVKVRLRSIFILGNCTVSSFVFSAKGPFNLTLENVTEEGTVSLVIDEDGTIRANQSYTEMTYQRINFQWGENATSMFTALVNTAGSALVASVRPYIQQRINEGLTVEVNKQLVSVPKVPAFSKTPPIDLAVIEGRKYVRDKYDPYTIDKIFDYDDQYLAFKVGPITVRGLSKFARVGDVKVGVVNRTAVINLHMVTGRLLGNLHFEFDFGKVGASRSGDTKFSVHHVQFETVVKQPLNLGMKPQLDDLQLEVGKVNVQMDGKGKFDYMLELATKFLPDMIRHFIVDALEETIARRIQQDFLNRVDSEKLILENIPLFEKLLQNSGDITNLKLN